MQQWLISLLVLMLLVGIYSYRTAKDKEKFQLKHIQTLKQEVEAQTTLNELDSHILAQTQDLIALIDDSGRIIRCNPAFQKHFSHLTPSNKSFWRFIKESLQFTTDAQIHEIRSQLANEGVYTKDVHFKHSPQQTHLLNLRRIQLKNQSGYLLSIANITELQAIHQQMEHNANHDAVTGLPNRFCFQKKLEQMIVKQNPFTLIYLDLDNFKQVNDTLGHPVGDKLLFTVSQQILSLMQTTQALDFTFARIGGDEFALLVAFEDQQLGPKSVQLSRNLLSQFNQPLLLDQHKIKVGCSLGVALYPEHGDTAEHLMSNADIALYEVKALGKNDFCLYHSEMILRAQKQLALENNILQALEKEEFEMHFQPQYRLSDMQLIGFEALIRWPNESSYIPPDEFIPFAEKNGLISMIDHYVLRKVCQQIADWRLYHNSQIKIAINLSSAEIEKPELFYQLKAAFSAYQIDPNLIELEVTEHSMSKAITTEFCPLKPLKELGIEISIDDFGTGYSSLAYLKNAHIDRIKIDKSFIQDIENNLDTRSIVETIIILGHKIGAKVLAEGIETSQQLKLLMAMNCDEGQGYLMSHPIKADLVPSQAAYWLN